MSNIEFKISTKKKIVSEFDTISANTATIAANATLSTTSKTDIKPETLSKIDLSQLLKLQSELIKLTSTIE